MSVERQMIGKQVEFVFQECGEAVAADAGHARIFAAPKVTVMHEQRVGPARDRLVHERERCGDAGNNYLHFGAPFHLQPIWAIIAETDDIEILVQVALEFCASHGNLPLTIQRAF